MASKNKIIVSLASICGVLVVALVAVISVWAATSADVKSTVYVSFTVDDVLATVSADYKIGDSGTYKQFGTKTFEGEDEEDIETFSAGSADSPLKLSTTDDCIILRFTFKNDSSTETYTINLNTSTYTGKNVDNYTITYASSTSSTLDSDSITGTTLADFGVDESGTTYAYILIKLNDFKSDSNLQAAIGWTLTNDDSDQT